MTVKVGTFGIFLFSKNQFSKNFESHLKNSKKIIQNFGKNLIFFLLPFDE